MHRYCQVKFGGILLFHAGSIADLRRRTLPDSTPEGAHLLLQVRTQVLNADWADTFRTWYPDFPPAYAAPMPTALAA